MKQLIFQTGCQPIFGESNATSINSTGSSLLLAKVLQGCAQNASGIPAYVDIIEKDQSNHEEAADSGAMMYIVVVLVFYSAGIVIMIIKYLHSEKRDMEEERIIEDFFKTMSAYKKEREQNNVNRVAIHAFHALTSFSCDNGKDDLVSTDEEGAHVTNNRDETIFGIEDECNACNANVSLVNELNGEGTSDDLHIKTNSEADTFTQPSGKTFEEQETLL